MTESSAPISDTSTSPEPVDDALTDVADVPTSDADDTDETELAPIDLDAIETDLAGVEQALVRLADGTYWTDEVTGGPIPDEVLDADPTARRAVQH